MANLKGAPPRPNEKLISTDIYIKISSRHFHQKIIFIQQIISTFFVVSHVAYQLI